MYNKTWNKHRTPQLEQQSTTNQEQQNRRLRTTNPFLVICTEKQFSDELITSVKMHLTTILG